MIRPGVSFDLREFAPRGRVRQFAGGFVYVIEREDNGHVKIGSSKNPAARCATLQTGSSSRLRVLHTAFAGARAEAVEFEAHGFLGARRLEGEWFDVSPETAIAAIYAAAGRIGVALGEDAYPAPQSGNVAVKSAIQAAGFMAACAAVILATAWLSTVFR